MSRRNLIQAVLVVLILAVMTALFAPLVVKVREEAARSQCTNNLRQLGIAIANYHDTYNNFPIAALPNRDLPPERRLSWIVQIWPFVEAGSIFHRIDFHNGWDAEENRFAALTALIPLHCPAYPERPPETTFYSSHYLGIAGIGSDAIQLPLEDRRAGFFGYERTFGMKDIAGRARSLLMLTETSRASGAWTAAGTPTTRGLVPDGSPYLGPNGQFGGTHRGGVNAVFADGSVRFIAQKIDPTVWEAMATLSGKGKGE